MTTADNGGSSAPQLCYSRLRDSAFVLLLNKTCLNVSSSYTVLFRSSSIEVAISRCAIPSQTTREFYFVNLCQNSVYYCASSWLVTAAGVLGRGTATVSLALVSCQRRSERQTSSQPDRCTALAPDMTCALSESASLHLILPLPIPFAISSSSPPHASFCGQSPHLILVCEHLR